MTKIYYNKEIYSTVRKTMTQGFFLPDTSKKKLSWTIHLYIHFPLARWRRCNSTVAENRNSVLTSPLSQLAPVSRLLHNRFCTKRLREVWESFEIKSVFFLKMFWNSDLQTLSEPSEILIIRISRCSISLLSVEVDVLWYTYIEDRWAAITFSKCNSSCLLYS